MKVTIDDSSMPLPESPPKPRRPSMEEELEEILREHLELGEENKGGNGSFGYFLYVSPRQRHSLHITHHRRYLKDALLRPQAKTALSRHIRQHQRAVTEMERLAASTLSED